MDPLLTLEYAIAAFESGDIEGCSDLLYDYSKWRAKGGFEPDGVEFRGEKLKGDAANLELIRHLSKRAQQCTR